MSRSGEVSWSTFADQVCEDMEPSVGFARIGMAEVQPHRPHTRFVRIELFTRHERNTPRDCLVEHAPGIDRVVQSKPVEQATTALAPLGEIIEVITQNLVENVATRAVEGDELLQPRGPVASSYRIVHDGLR